MAMFGGGLSAAYINGLKAHFLEFYQVKLMEDNQASITVMSTRNSSTMRYASKTQNICFKWRKDNSTLSMLGLTGKPPAS